MKKTHLFYLAIILLTFNSFTVFAQSHKSNNYVVLIDLSDRILSPHQKDYDIKVIKSVFSKFERMVRSKLFLTSEDSFNIRIIPQNGSPIDSYEYGNLLSLDLGSLPPQNRVTSFKKFKENFYTNISKLYDRAKFSDNPKDYNGVDIWQYFNESIEYDLTDDKQNILVILTDGYLDFESYPQGFQNKNKFTSTTFMKNLRVKEWREIDKKNNYGLIPITSTTDFDMKIIVAGIRSKSYINFLDESRVLKYFWTKWFNEMNLKNHFVIAYANSPSVHHLIEKSI